MRLYEVGCTTYRVRRAGRMTKPPASSHRLPPTSHLVLSTSCLLLATFYFLPLTSYLVSGHALKRRAPTTTACKR